MQTHLGYMMMYTIYIYNIISYGFDIIWNHEVKAYISWHSGKNLPRRIFVE